MKAIWPFVGGSVSTHKWNLKDPRDLDAAHRLVFNGGWTHSATGAQPNGSTGYADTKLNPVSVLSASSGSMGFYCRTEAAGSGQPYDMGCDNGDTNPLIVIARYSNNNAYLNYGDASNGFVPNGASSDGRGLWAVNRLDSAESLTRGFRNGSSFTSANVGVTLPNRNIYLGCNNRNGSAIYFSAKEHALTYVSSGLTADEHADLYTAVQAFQTALGRQV